MEDATCTVCGVEVKRFANGRARKYCSRRCTRWASSNLNTRTCERDHCNEPHRAKGLCVKHHSEAFPSEGRYTSHEVPCAVCGVIVTKRNLNRRAVCSYDCRTILQFGRPKPPPPPKSTEPPLVVVKSSGCIWVAGDCEWCGDSFTRARVAQGIRYCTVKCQKAASKARHRATSGQFAISPVRRRRLYERDGWTCQICLEPVDREAHYMDDWAPSLDHIVPQSHTLIPDHSDENLRTAHRWCNAVRGDLSHYTDADLLVGA